MVCSNPDLEIIRGKKKEICAGSIAMRYEQLGGEVKYYGKPYSEIYQKSYETIKIKNKKKNFSNRGFFENRYKWCK